MKTTSINTYKFGPHQFDELKLEGTVDRILVTNGATDETFTTPLVTVIATSLHGTEYESTTVVQLAGNEEIQAMIDQLKKAMN